MIDDPGCNEANNIIIVGGTNDVFNDNVENPEKFAFAIDKSVQKIQELALTNREKRFTLITPMLDEEDLSDEQIIRAQYITAKAKEINADHLSHLGLDQIEDHAEDTPTHLDMEDVRHPSTDGTKTLINMIRDTDNNSLVWNPKFVISDSHYRRIQKLWMYGCKGCHRFPVTVDDYRICEECNKEFQNMPPNEKLKEIITSMKERQSKRKRNSDDDDDDGKHNRPPRNVWNTQSGIGWMGTPKALRESHGNEIEMSDIAHGSNDDFQF